MLIETIIVCRSDVSRPRSRKLLPAMSAFPVTLMIEEVAAAEAPVFMTIEDLRVGSESGRMDVRLHGDRAFVLHPEHRSDISAQQDVVRRWITDFLLLTGLSANDRTTGVEPRRMSVPEDRIIGSPLDDVVVLVQRRLREKFLIVDGMLNETVLSPLEGFEPGDDTDRKSREPVSAWFAKGPTGLRKNSAVEIIDPIIYERCRVASVDFTDFEPMIAFLARQNVTDEDGPSHERIETTETMAITLRGLVENARGSADIGELVRRMLETTEPPTGRALALARPWGPPEQSGEFSTRKVHVPFLPKTTSRNGRLPSLADQRASCVWIESEIPVILDAKLVCSLPSQSSGRRVWVRDADWFIETGRGLSWAGDRLVRLHRVGSSTEPGEPDATAVVLTMEAVGHGDQAAFPQFGSRWAGPEQGCSSMEAQTESFAVYVRRRMVDLGGGLLAYRCAEPMLSSRAEDGRIVLEAEFSISMRESPGMRPPMLFALDDWEGAKAFADLFPGRDRRITAEPQMAHRRIAELDVDMWNLRASMMRLVGRPQAGLRLLTPKAALALCSVARDLDGWSVSSSTRIPEDDAVLLEAAATLLDDLARPIFRGMYSRIFFDMAVSSLQACFRRGSEKNGAIEDDLEFRNFTM